MGRCIESFNRHMEISVFSSCAVSATFRVASCVAMMSCGRLLMLETFKCQVDGSVTVLIVIGRKDEFFI